MKQRLLRKLIEKRKIGHSYACIDNKIFENRSGSIIYSGMISKNKRYSINPTNTTINYKGRSEPLSHNQLLAIEIGSDIIRFLYNKITSKEIEKIFS